MTYAFEDLKQKTVAELREIASGIEHEALKGYTQLNKEHLLAALCQALGIDMHVHHQVVGINKIQLKSKIKQLKKKRDEFLAAHDHKELKRMRRQMRQLKKTMRKSTV